MASSRRLTSHAAVECLLRRRRRVLSPVIRRKNHAIVKMPFYFFMCCDEVLTRNLPCELTAVNKWEHLPRNKLQSNSGLSL